MNLTEQDLIDSGWKRTASGRYKHPDLTANGFANRGAGAHRVQLVTLGEAIMHQRNWERQAEAALERELRKSLSEALTRPLLTDEQITQRANLIDALVAGMGGLPGAGRIVAERQAREDRAEHDRQQDAS